MWRDYLPGLGFQLRKDFRYGTAQYFRNEDGTAESREIQPEMEFDFRQGATLVIGALSTFESVREPFSISDVVVPVGEYWFHQGTFMLRLPRLRLALSPAWVVSRFLELEGGYEVNRLDFADRGAGATTQLARLRVKTALNPHMSLSTFGQYSSATGLWIVYNEGLYNERDNGPGPRRRHMRQGASQFGLRPRFQTGAPHSAAPRGLRTPCQVFSRSGQFQHLCFPLGTILGKNGRAPTQMFPLGTILGTPGQHPCDAWPNPPDTFDTWQNPYDT